MSELPEEESKEALAAALRRHLSAAAELRRRAPPGSTEGDDRLALRAWQAARLAESHAHFLASERFGEASRFFLDDLYGPKDFSERDEEVERILPMLVAMLPESALQAMALAVELDALSEDLDAAMIAELRRTAAPATAPGRVGEIDVGRYVAAYVTVGRRPERLRQIALIGEVGAILEHLARKSLLSTLLKLMAGPAQLAGLGELHAFLAHGFAAFRRMGDDASEFLDGVARGEKRLLERLFAGDPDAFAPFATQA
ncbi:FFLEELY motif protein [Rhodocyclus tenuis]|uniref:DUF8198 domain-containing protein n=1 Tax=Rhodocyclus tenuis TaxID=1066 RepID=A0A840GB08_RHOTE|nr:hypothetical protein [Rhodocyclus tenuis]MBB4248080.1 hypothetical protein [Rhodocyclus tenuis]